MMSNWKKNHKNYDHGITQLYVAICIQLIIYTFILKKAIKEDMQIWISKKKKLNK